MKLMGLQWPCHYLLHPCQGAHVFMQARRRVRVHWPCQEMLPMELHRAAACQREPFCQLRCASPAATVSAVTLRRQEILTSIRQSLLV